MVSQLADEIDSKLLTAQEHLIAVGEATPKDIMQSTEKAQAFLDNRPSLHSMFDNHLFIFTPSGKIFVESPYAPGRRGFDVSSREYIINTLKTKKPYISDPYVSSQLHKHPAIMLTVPLFDGNGKITGILAGGIDLMRDNFLGRISTAKIGKAGYLYLTALDRTLIMHPDKKRILTKQAPGLNRLYDKAIEGFEGTDEALTSYGIEMVSSFKRMNAKNWILIANYPSVEAYRPVRRAQQYFLVATIAGIIAVFIIISFIIKYLINPLELFTRHVEDLPQKTGDDRFLNIKTKDEIGTLSLAFNKMVAEIDKRSALERSEELYRTITEFSTDFVFWRAPDNKILYVSENCEKFCGYTEGEFYASPELLETMIHPDDRTIWAEHIHDISSKGIHEQLELRIITKSGQVRWITHICLPVYDKKGTYRGRRGSHRDITQRKQADEALKTAHNELELRVEERTNELATANAALREGEERLSLALKAAGQSIYDSDLKTGKAIVSPEYALMLGYDPAEFHETTAKWLERLHPDDRKPVTAVYKAYIRGEIPEYRVEFRQKTKDGKWKWMLSLSKIIERDADGKPLRMIGTHTDITERKELEAQLHHAQKMEGIGILAGGVAHDFNNILQAITGYGYLAQMMLKDNPTTQAYIQGMLDAANHAAELTRGLLAFSRKQVITPMLVDLNAIVMNIEKMLRRIIGEDIELITALSAGELPVLVDAGQMEQVMMNLATNARDAMPDGGQLSIQTEAVYVDSHYAEVHFFQNADTYAVLRVSDTGIGMDQATKDNIFEPFFTTKEVGKGTGLGLSMVYGIIKQHNGNIRVYSEAERGTTFKIYLPLAQRKREAISIATKTLPRGQGETIMIAEDEPQVRVTMRLILHENGYKIIEAENGEDAVRKFQENRGEVSLIILDTIMPLKNGREAYEEIKCIAPGVKTIFMSGYTADIISKKGILEEGFDLISKPINPDTLLRKIRDVLDR